MISPVVFTVLAIRLSKSTSNEIVYLDKAVENIQDFSNSYSEFDRLLKKTDPILIKFINLYHEARKNTNKDPAEENALLVKTVEELRKFSKKPVQKNLKSSFIKMLMMVVAIVLCLIILTTVLFCCLKTESGQEANT